MVLKQKRKVDLDLIKYVKTLPCIAHLGEHPADDAHHLITKASGGPDTYWNLFPCCREVHQYFHNKGISKAAKKWPAVEIWLLASGWEFNKYLQKWKYNGEDE